MIIARGDADAEPLGISFGKFGNIVRASTFHDGCIVGMEFFKILLDRSEHQTTPSWHRAEEVEYIRVCRIHVSSHRRLAWSCGHKDGMCLALGLRVGARRHDLDLEACFFQPLFKTPVLAG